MKYNTEEVNVEWDILLNLKDLLNELIINECFFASVK